MTKMYDINKRLIVDSWRLVANNDGAAGIDKLTIAEIQKDYKGYLYTLWNRMSSGSYMASPVRKVTIPKADGKERILGIPTVLDRVAQMAAVKTVSERIDGKFHEDSYGYRPKKSAHQAIDKAKERCYRYPWVVDLDIQSFFDTIPHDQMMEMVERRIEDPWIKLYIKRWLKAEMMDAKGNVTSRELGTPQGGVISPLLANMYLDEAFDWWINQAFPRVKFERYADDIIIHCNSKIEAQEVLDQVRERMSEYGLTLHPEKTKIIYCKSKGRNLSYPNVTFTFLGYQWKPRSAIERTNGKLRLAFTPAVSTKAQQKIRNTIRSWKLNEKTHVELKTIATTFNKRLQGWIAYYGQHRKSELGQSLKYLDERLVQWIRKKHKIKSYARAWDKLKAIKQTNPKLFAHWFIPINSTITRRAV